MGKVQVIKRSPIYRDIEEELDYIFEPVEDSITIKKTKTGYEARYLVQDDNPMSPEEMDDDSLFLVNYHRDFEVRRDEVITKDDLVNWYRQDCRDYDDREFTELYHIFALSCLVHSGVWLSLSRSFSCDLGGWDTSHVGAVLACKKEWPKEADALAAAELKVQEWNQYLSGDIYGIVKETYNKKKIQVDHDSCWGFYGHKYALEELKEGI